MQRPVRLAFIAGIAPILVACVRGEPARLDPPAGTAGAAGARPGPGDGGGGGVRRTADSPCDRCAVQRTACRELFEQCQADAECRMVLDCVFSGAGCALDASGAVCVSACTALACAAERAVALFAEADRCAYCTSECAESCAEYCAATEYDPIACAGGAAGAPSWVAGASGSGAGASGSGTGASGGVAGASGGVAGASGGVAGASGGVAGSSGGAAAAAGEHAGHPSSAGAAGRFSGPAQGPLGELTGGEGVSAL